ncbi:MAG: MarR family transcriptional regulator [Sphingopyxis sp.]|nr:MarR family transcriptional regulator [Sphingopyxis sp.]
MSSTLTLLLKRLEAVGMVSRTRNPSNERQVVVALTDTGRALQSRAGCLGDALLEASGQSPAALGVLNKDIRALRDAVYANVGGWDLTMGEKA